LEPNPKITSSFSPVPVAIVVVVYDTPLPELQECFVSILHSVAFYLRKKPRNESLSITIVHNGGSQLTRNEFDSCLKQFSFVEDIAFSIISGHGNIGYGRAHNLAFSRQRDGYHIFMNPDVRLAPDALYEGLRFLIQHDDVVLASPACTDADKKRAYLCKRYPSLAILFLRGFSPSILKRVCKSSLSRYEMWDLVSDEPHIGIPIVSGCFMMCKDAAFDSASGFDPKFFLYFEDFDLSLRLNRIGKLAFVPAMRITHSGGNAAKKGIKHILMFLRSAIRFFNIHGWKWV